MYRYKTVIVVTFSIKTCQQYPMRAQNIWATTNMYVKKQSHCSNPPRPRSLSEHPFTNITEVSQHSHLSTKESINRTIQCNWKKYRIFGTSCSITDKSYCSIILLIRLTTGGIVPKSVFNKSIPWYHYCENWRKNCIKWLYSHEWQNSREMLLCRIVGVCCL